MRPDIEYCVQQIDEALDGGGKECQAKAKHCLSALYDEFLRLQDVIDSFVKERNRS